MTEHDPAETQWHHWPRCWYPAARVHGFAPGQVRSGRLGAQEWVLYRDADGTFRATDAFCPHMGAHLKSARVEGQALCCGLHGCLIEPQTALSDGLPPSAPAAASARRHGRAPNASASSGCTRRWPKAKPPRPCPSPTTATCASPLPAPSTPTGAP